jgi:hypothetical protein
MNVTQEIDDFNLNWDSYREPWRAIEFARKLGDKLNEVQEKYDTLAVENMLEVNMICKQRDAAMDVLSKVSHFLSCGIGDETTTAKQFGDRIIDGFVDLSNRLGRERDLAEAEKNKYKKLLDQAEEALMKIEDIYIDGDDTCEDWKSMGQIARTFLEKTYESGINQNN